MIAPPQVQAHNFAKAIRTDIVLSLFDQGPRLGVSGVANSRMRIPIC